MGQTWLLSTLYWIVINHKAPCKKERSRNGNTSVRLEIYKGNKNENLSKCYFYRNLLFSFLQDGTWHLGSLKHYVKLLCLHEDNVGLRKLNWCPNCTTACAQEVAGGRFKCWKKKTGIITRITVPVVSLM